MCSLARAPLGSVQLPVNAIKCELFDRTRSASILARLSIRADLRRMTAPPITRSLMWLQMAMRYDCARGRPSFLHHLVLTRLRLLSQNSAARIGYSSAERQSWFNIMVPSPQRLSSVFVKIQGVARFTATTIEGDEILLDSALTRATDWKYKKYDLPPDRIIQSFRLEADSSGASNGYCYAGEVNHH